MSGILCPQLVDKKGQMQECIGDKCAWHIRIIGQDPQTGEEKNSPGCAVAWLPHLLINNSKEIRQMSASMDGARNRMSEVGKAVEKSTANVNNVTEKVLKFAANLPLSRPNSAPVPAPVILAPALPTQTP